MALKCSRMRPVACSSLPPVWRGLTAQPIMKLSEYASLREVAAGSDEHAATNTEAVRIRSNLLFIV